MMGELTYQIEPVSLTVTDIRTMTLLLESPENEAVGHVLEWITKYAEQNMRNRINLLNMKIVPLLMKLSASKSAQIRKLVTTCLSAISEVSEVHSELRNPLLIQRLILLLNPEEQVEVQEEAAFTLGQLARDFSNKAEIRKNGGMKALLKLLPSADPDVKKNSAFALNSLLEDYASRTELRLLNGFPLLLDLLHADYPEIIENSLHCLIRCSEDVANRVEIRRASGLKRLLTVLEHSIPQVVVLALTCLANCLEDVEMNSSISEFNGVQSVVQLLNSPDIKVKYHAEIVLYKIAKQEKNIGYVRESGALNMLVANLGSSTPGAGLTPNDYPIVANSALALSGMARNEMNQNDLMKAGAIDTLIKLLSIENSDIRRNTLLALGQLSAHSAKIRAKIRAIDGIKLILSVLQNAHNAGKDINLIANSVECISSLAEDAADRAEITRLSGIQLLVSVLKHNDTHLYTVVAMALARCLQDADARAQLYESKGGAALFHLLSLNNEDVCRNAAWALSNAALSEPIAHEACNLGALEHLLKLTKSSSRNLSQFALDALEKILNFHMPAKYWLRNRLAPENLIQDDFYDVGSAGSNSDLISGFPTLAELLKQPVDTKREILWVNWPQDSGLNELLASAQKQIQENVQPSQANSKLSYIRIQCIKIIAEVVCDFMGGKFSLKDAPFGKDDLSYKFHIAELKVQRNSNVLPLGAVRRGSFYHRALLFKTIADKVFGSLPDSQKKRISSAGSERGPMEPPVLAEVKSSAVRISLIRGEYGRAWNTIFLKPYEVDEDKAVEDPLVALGAKEDEYLVDLMYDPAKLIPVTSPESELYQRIQL